MIKKKFYIRSHLSNNTQNYFLIFKTILTIPVYEIFKYQDID